MTELKTIQARNPRRMSAPPIARREINAKLDESALEQLDRIEREADLEESGKPVSKRADPIPFQPVPIAPSAPGSTLTDTTVPWTPSLQPTQQPAGDCVGQLIAQGFSEEQAQMVCQQFDVGNIAASLLQEEDDDSSGLMLSPIINTKRVRPSVLSAKEEKSPERFAILFAWVRKEYPSFTREAQIEITRKALSVNTEE